MPIVDYTKSNILGEYASLDNFIRRWTADEKKEQIRSLLRDRGIDLDSFEGVIQALLDDPAGFSIAGFEEFYSKQEQEMLLDIRNKLMNNIGEKASTAAKPDSSELL